MFKECVNRGTFSKIYGCHQKQSATKPVKKYGQYKLFCTYSTQCCSHVLPSEGITPQWAWNNKPSWDTTTKIYTSGPLYLSQAPPSTGLNGYYLIMQAFSYWDFYKRYKKDGLSLIPRGEIVSLHLTHPSVRSSELPFWTAPGEQCSERCLALGHLCSTWSCRDYCSLKRVVGWQSGGEASFYTVRCARIQVGPPQGRLRL